MWSRRPIFRQWHQHWHRYQHQRSLADQRDPGESVLPGLEQCCRWATYALTAVATDSAGNTATSAPVEHLCPDQPAAGDHHLCPRPGGHRGHQLPQLVSARISTASNYVSGTNTATFLVHRDSATNIDLTVYYSIGGTASNGEDYDDHSRFGHHPGGQELRVDHHRSTRRQRFQLS